MLILSLETSCDETAAALIQWDGQRAEILANTVSSQAELHAQWGGVVPNVASREHLAHIVPVIDETLRSAKKTSSDVDLIAVTQGPGLIPALLIGVSAAKALALVWQKPLIGIHHIEGHIYANFISSQIPNGIREAKTFPLLALVVSGGHTQLMLMRDHFQYEILGETQDDAAGEAFDKVARLLGLPYPGGPIVSNKADEFRSTISEGTMEAASLFPRPMINSHDFDFSFSGLKTSVLYFLKKHPEKMSTKGGSASGGKIFINAVCHEFQEAVVDVLVSKTKRAIEKYQPKTLIIAGGVSANRRLRERLQILIDTLNLEASLPSERIVFRTPEFTYSLDNAAMIGVAAAYRYDRMTDEQKSSLMKNYLTLEPNANLLLQHL